MVKLIIKIELKTHFFVIPQILLNTRVRRMEEVNTQMKPNMQMQSNYAALYEYICDNPVYSRKVAEKMVTDRLLLEQFWKAVLAKIDDNLLQIPP